MKIPKYLCGGIGAGEWCKMSAKKAVKAHCLGRCNNVVIEAMAPAYQTNGGSYTMPMKDVYAKLSEFIRTFTSISGMWVTLHLVNGGDEMLKNIGADKIIEGILKPLVKDFKPSKSRIIICPVAEYHGEPGQDTLISAVVNLWGAAGGHVMHNGTGRATSLIQGHDILDYHTQSIEDQGPKIDRMSLVDTDNGPIINYLRYGATFGRYWNPERVKDMAQRCKARGNGLNLYAFSTTFIDKKALQVLGDVYAIKRKLMFWDKLKLRLALLFL